MIFSIKIWIGLYLLPALLAGALYLTTAYAEETSNDQCNPTFLRQSTTQNIQYQNLT
jgi:hypothetical protein